jgi:hypothetical protein
MDAAWRDAASRGGFIGFAYVVLEAGAEARADAEQRAYASDPAAWRTKGPAAFSTVRLDGAARPHSREKPFPTHLVSGTMICDTCGATMGQVSGKGGGYYGCICATKGPVRIPCSSGGPSSSG